MNCEHSILENRAFVENNFIFKKDAGPEAPPSDPASFFCCYSGVNSTVTSVTLGVPQPQAAPNSS